MIDLMLESSGSSPGKTNLKLTKSGKPKKVSDRKGKPTPNGDWLKKMKLEHDEEMKAFHDASESKRGTAMTFASTYRKEHEEEYKTFVASWKESHTDSDTGSTVSLEETVDVVAPVVTVVPTAVVPAKKAVKKAQKAITTPIAATVQSDVTEEILPFTMGGMTYLRAGYQRPDGNHLWTSAHLWQSKKGAKGAYIGQLQLDGTINTDADEPSV